MKIWSLSTGVNTLLSINAMAKFRYLTPPGGYLIAEAIRSDNTERLRSLALEMINPNDPKIDEFNKIMGAASLQELHDFFKSNGYSFQSKPALKKGGLWEAMQAGDPR